MSEVNARTVLWYLAFVGFAVNYMVRINVNITIVEMVKKYETMKLYGKNNIENIILTRKFLANTKGFSGNSTKGNNKITNQKSIERIILDALNIEYERNGFSWNEYEQELVLGSFYWVHWITQIPGGILAKKYGTKLIFGLGNATASWLCFILPILAYLNYKIFVFVIAIQGFCCGFTWPAMHHMASVWIPPNERSHFVTSYLGSSIGIAVFLPVFGYIMYISSWEWVFHLCGIIGTIWYIFWLYYAYDTPALHPRISQSELVFIEQSLGTNSLLTNQQHYKIPWKEILLSKAVWINIIAQFGTSWSLFTLLSQGPIYFGYIHNWDIGMTGILSGTPHFSRMLFAYVFSIYGDYLLRTDKMSRTNVRKLATSVCNIVNGIFIIGLAYSGENTILAIIFFTLATMVSGAITTGPLASMVDIAPNYAGVILGIGGVIVAAPGFLSPIVVGMLTLGNQTIESWKYVFLVTAGLIIGCGILYVLIADATIQSWNSPKEIELLNTNKT